MTINDFLQLARLLSKICQEEHLSHRKRDVIWEVIELCIKKVEVLTMDDKNEIPF